jgi:AcrR family transcriptional regulator
MESGLRERKKQRTRRQISDAATALFVARSFEEVTVADVARAADVSVNTVFNYFPRKEDLFFDRAAEVIERLATVVRERRPGESALAAVRRDLLEALDRGEETLGADDGAPAFWRVVEGSPALQARAREIAERAVAALAATLADATGAGPDDVLPRAVAGQLAAARETLFAEIRRRIGAGEPAAAVRSAVREAAPRVFDLLEPGLGGYAVRPP